MARICFFAQLLLLLIAHACLARAKLLKSPKLCSQCSVCNLSRCPASEAYPHMTAWDNSLIAGALQSDYVAMGDGGVYAVPNIKGGTSKQYNAYFGWQSNSGSTAGFHKFSNFMDKCSSEAAYLAVDAHGNVGLRALTSLDSPVQADWKSIAPPPKLNHNNARFWRSGSSGKCLTVFGAKSKEKRVVGVADCKFDGSNPFQVFAFRFHYHNAFCCCDLYND